MTLVLGYADAKIGFLVSDSLLTPAAEHYAGSGPVAGQFHGLKIQIIRPDVAIAYASSNDADGALKTINDLSSELAAEGVVNIPERLHEKYRRAIDNASATVPDSEFLVLEITKEGKVLAHVTAERVIRCNRAYIGDAAEYKSLRNLPNSYVPPTIQTVVSESGEATTIPLSMSDGEVEFGMVSDAMEALVHRRKGSVGAIAGCTIRVVDARISKSLEYLQAVEVSVNPWEGQSGFSLLASNTGARGIGIFYRSGKLGFILKVGDEEHVRKEYAETLQEFIVLAKEKYDLSLVGGSW